MTIHAPVKATKPTLGPDHGIAIGTPVLTLDGTIPVEYLTPGDRIVTRSGARKLVEVEVTVVQNARVIRINAAALVASRLQMGVTVSPNQPVLIKDWRAKALTGKPVATIPAALLVDGAYIRAEVVAELRLYTLRFEEDVVIYAGDLELACTGAPVAA